MKIFRTVNDAGCRSCSPPVEEQLHISSEGKVCQQYTGGCLFDCQAASVMSLENNLRGQFVFIALNQKSNNRTQQPAATCHKHRGAQGFTIFSLVVFGYMPCWENLDHQILCPGHEPQPSDNWWLPDRSTWKRTIQLHSKFRTKQVSITVYSVKNHLVIMLKMSELLVTYFLSDTLQPTNNAKSCSESFHTRQLARPAVVDRICSHQVRQQP